MTLKRWTPPILKREGEPVDRKPSYAYAIVMQLLDDVNDGGGDDDDAISSSNEKHSRALLRLARYFFFLATLFYWIGAYLVLNNTEGGWFAYSVGSLLFAVTGTLECCSSESVCLNLFLFLAGIFGFASEMLNSANEHTESGRNNDALHFIAMHMFLVESLKLMYQHWFESNHVWSCSLTCILWVSDVFFFGNSFMNVILSYGYLTKIAPVTLGEAELVGATFWVISSFLAIVAWHKSSRLTPVLQEEYFSGEPILEMI